MKITIEINPKEIADLAVKGQGQPNSCGSSHITSSAEVYGSSNIKLPKDYQISFF